MAQGTGPRPVGASAGAGEAKETFPEFLRALWVPVGAEAAAAGGEGAGVGCGLGEERAEHGGHCPTSERPQKPCCWEPGQPKSAAMQPGRHPHSTREPGRLQGGRQRALGCGEPASLPLAATTGAAQDPGSAARQAPP